MLRQRRLRQLHALGELADAQFLIQQMTKDQQPLGIGHSSKQFGRLVGPRFEFCDIHLDILEYSNICVNENVPAARDTGKYIMSNLGTLDRIIRFTLGALLVVAPVVTGWPIWSDSLAFWGAIIVGVS